MKQNIILLFAKPYRMEKDDKTGFNEGISIQYLLTDELSPVNGESERGMRFSKSSIPLLQGKSISKVPALYEGSFDLKSDAQGKILLKLTDVKYLSEINMVYPEIK